MNSPIDKKFFSTAFKWACWRNNPSIAKYLLECGADYKSETTSKSELLFWICGLGHKEIIKLLLELNVDFKTKVKFKGKMMTYDGSPLDRAIVTNQTSLTSLKCNQNTIKQSMRLQQLQEHAKMWSPSLA